MLIIIPLLVVLSGCGNPSIPVAEVEGTVELDGKPLDRIQVEFWPEGEGLRSIGTTDSEGRFKLMTDNGQQQGAAIGTHRVVLHDAAALGDKFLGRAGEDADMSQGKKPRIAGAYASPEETNLTAEVVAGKKNEFTFKVDPFAGAGS